MKKIILCFSMFLCLILLGFTGKEVTIQLKDIEEVSEIQLNTAKISIQHFGKERAIKLMDEIREAPLLDEGDRETIQNNGYYHTVSIIYNDGSKDMFLFFKVDDKWYMETTGGTIFKDAEFITSYIDWQEINMEPYLGVPSEWELKLNKQFSILDLRYFFIEEVKQKMEYGISEEDAVLYAKEKINRSMTIYQYALEEGYELPETEYDKLMEKHIEEVESAVNYEEIEEYYEEFDTTLKDYILKLKEYYRVMDTIDKLYKIKYEEFKNGKDKINGKVCDDVEEYWYRFVSEVIYEKAEKYDMSNFLNELKDAEEYYYRHYSQMN